MMVNFSEYLKPNQKLIFVSYVIYIELEQAIINTEKEINTLQQHKKKWVQILIS